ncbi:MAG: NAD(P)H-hydrate dehydratase [Pyrinomonadaceae bacterium]|nr:NAD(P)H-hydrate dehydratase [Pyrinomonadaceae bacterium]
MAKSKKSTSSSTAVRQKPLLISPSLLRRWALPQPDGDADKDERGQVLVIGGAAEMPGAVILAATAALRVGAGKLQIATCRSVAPHVATAMPEARVFALPETKSGAIATTAIARLVEQINRAQAVLIGPGMIDETAVVRLMEKVLPQIESPALILDAAALSALVAHPQSLHKLRGRAVLTPHANEMSELLKLDKSEIAADPQATLCRAVAEFAAVVVLKGRETLIAAPHSKIYCNRAGNVGLATSGSGDTLAGLIAGLAARGAAPLQAAVWGVHLHARAGDELARKFGPLGYLARELPAEIPRLLTMLERRKKD